MFQKEIELIFSIIKEELSLDKEIVISKKRKPEIVDARRIFSVICKRNSKLSLAKIGLELGGKNHAGILSLIRSHEGLYESDKKYASKFDNINNKFLTNKLLSNKISSSIEEMKNRKNSLVKKIENSIDNSKTECVEENRKNLKIGLFFGDFNPLHNGHLILANECYHQFEFDEIWFVISSEKKYDNNYDIISLKERFNIVKKCIADNPFFKVSDMENKVENPSNIDEVLESFKKKYPKHIFSLIINLRTLQKFHKIKNYETIVMYHDILYYENHQFPTHYNLAQTYNAKLIEQPFHFNISSQKIREIIKKGNSLESLRYLIPKECLYIVEKNNFYKNDNAKNRINS